ncbi:hypothetical protein ANN_16450 [Periplaneta americana]|uniref:Transposase n=1 Tax=Periplaneta americana TaxID=6978 RepID=A0ABQ8SKY0_PERAM|nr:hypothetical protein ANN_16450 [Periplaneta americana]
MCRSSSAVTSSIVLNRRWRTATGMDLSASTVHRRLLRAGLLARTPLRRLPLSKTTNASDCNGQDNLTSIKEVLEPEVLPLLQATPHPIFQQDSTRPHVARIVQAFFEERRISLLPWPARSPDISPIEHVWDMSIVRVSIQRRSKTGTYHLVQDSIGKYVYIYNTVVIYLSTSLIWLRFCDKKPTEAKMPFLLARRVLSLLNYFRAEKTEITTVVSMTNIKPILR